MTLSHTAEIVCLLESLGEPFEVASDCPWLATLESAFGVQLPEPFRSLVSGYRWAEFEVGPVAAFSNLGVHSEYDLLSAPFADEAISGWLLPRGLLQVGRLSTGSYDPVCLNVSTTGAHVPVVSVAHEDILLSRKRVSVNQVAGSLKALVREAQSNYVVKRTAQRGFNVS